MKNNILLVQTITLCVIMYVICKYYVEIDNFKNIDLDYEYSLPKQHINKKHKNTIYGANGRETEFFVQDKKILGMDFEYLLQ